MTGFVRRFTEIPPVNVIKEIEGVVIIDRAPVGVPAGVGTGTVLIVGEFEDGFFSTDEAAKGAVEVFGSTDLGSKFGGFGYSYGANRYQNVSARKHLQEDWNGNGFLKLYKLQASRLLVSRVDTSVGTVAFEAVAKSDSAPGNYSLTAGQTLTVLASTGAVSSPALAAAAATVTGTGAAFNTIVSGDAFGVKIDGGPQVNVLLGGADTTVAAVISRVNTALGYTAASDDGGQLKLAGIRQGTGGSVELIEVAPGVLAKLGLTAGTTAGTGDVVDVTNVTPAELVAFINEIPTIGTINAAASFGPDNNVRVIDEVTGAASAIQVAGDIAEDAGFPIGIQTGIPVEAVSIPAGTRVRNSGGGEWVTMQTLDIPAGNEELVTAKVRPALDNGTATGAAAGTVNVLVDPPAGGQYVVTNPSALTAALTENQLDNRYIEALNATLDPSSVAQFASYLLMARRSDTLVREGRSNAEKATACGAFGRKYITGDPLGTDMATIIANVALYRSDRVFYTGKGMRVRIPQIAELGTAGGQGFTADGFITVRPDGPLTSVCATLPPETNPGQDPGGILDDFVEVDSFGEQLSIESYKAARREGIVLPRVDREVGMIFLSGVTSSLESGRTNIARRKMADFINDQFATLFTRRIKKLNSLKEREGIKSDWEAFLETLKSTSNPDNQRIVDFSVSDGEDVGNTPESLAQGNYWLRTTVRTLSSLDNIITDNVIGENAQV